jgi:YD repeat-containing protein
MHTQESSPEGTLNYSYDLAGNLLSLAATSATTGNTVTTNYTYDALNRLSTVTEANTGTTKYNYDPAGNLASFYGAQRRGASIYLR